MRRAALQADPLLTEGYRRCAQITRRFGTTYYWGALLLPPERRHHVYAVYALCRLADDIVDDAGATSPARGRCRRADRPRQVAGRIDAIRWRGGIGGTWI